MAMPAVTKSLLKLLQEKKDAHYGKIVNSTLVKKNKINKTLLVLDMRPGRATSRPTRYPGSGA